MSDDVEFRVIEEDHRYRISRDGRMQSRARGEWRDRRPSPHSEGYLEVALGRKKRLVHRLVLQTFVGPCPEGMEALHGNDIRTDNRLENLRWGTPEENVQDAFRNGHRARCGERYHGARLSDATIRAILGRLAEGALQREVAEEFGTSQPNVSGLIHGTSRNDVTGLPRRPPRAANHGDRDDGQARQASRQVGRDDPDLEGPRPPRRGRRPTCVGQCRQVG